MKLSAMGIDIEVLLSFERTRRWIGGVRCSISGHPKSVDVCFGQVTCARCESILGDCLMGAFNFHGYKINGKDAEDIG